jgi:hypothetical protein
MTNDNDLDDGDIFTPDTPEERAAIEEMIRHCENNAWCRRIEEDDELAKLIEAIVHEVKDRTDLEIREHIWRRLRIRRGW